MEYVLFLPVLGTTKHTNDFARRRKIVVEGRHVRISGNSDVEQFPFAIAADVRIKLPHFGAGCHPSFQMIILPYKPRDPYFKIKIPIRENPPAIRDLFLSHVIPAINAINSVTCTTSSQHNETHFRVYEKHWEGLLSSMKLFADRLVRWRKQDLACVFVHIPEDVVELIARFEVVPFTKPPFRTISKLLRHLVANSCSLQMAYSSGRSSLRPVLAHLHQLIADTLERGNVKAPELLRECTQEETTIVTRFETSPTPRTVFGNTSTPLTLLPDVEEFWEIVAPPRKTGTSYSALCIPRAVARVLTKEEVNGSCKTSLVGLFSSYPRIPFMCVCKGNVFTFRDPFSNQ